MGYAIPTSDQFKETFRRDFPYSVVAYGSVIALTVLAGVITNAVPMAGGYNYSPGAAVNISDSAGSGAVIAATVQGGTLISCAVTSGGTGYVAPTATLFGGDNSNLHKVTDDDINLAIFDADYNMNEGLFSDQATFTRAYLLLAAHNLVGNILASTEGLSSQYSWLTESKSVDGVHQKFKIPDKIAEDPFLASLSTTRYGLAYLTIVMPFTVGHTMALFRVTNPV